MKCSCSLWLGTALPFIFENEELDLAVLNFEILCILFRTQSFLHTCRCKCRGNALGSSGLTYVLELQVPDYPDK